MKMNLSVAVIAILLIVLAVIYLFGGTGTPDVLIDYHVSITDPASGLLDITMVITPPRRPWVHLYLREPHLSTDENRIISMQASRNHRSIPVWQTFPGKSDMKTIWTGFRTTPVTLTYRINPLWMKGPNAPRSYLGSEFGYLRGVTTLFSPIAANEIISQGDNGISSEAGQATIRFSLPVDWSVISPLAANEKTTAALLRNIYFGVGKFAVTRLEQGERTFVVGVYQGLGDQQVETYLAGIPLLFSTMTASLGFSPSGHTHNWAVTILPHEPIHGGAAGTGSLISDPELYILSHEMFHWWNGETVATTPDANWIKEGFTKYYEGKMLYHAGLWNDEDYAYHLSKPRGTFRSADSTFALNLVRASEQLVNENKEEAYDEVYFGGMAVAWYLDTELRANGTSLDIIWPELEHQKEPVTTTVFLEKLADIGGTDIAGTCSKIIYGKQALPLP